MMRNMTESMPVREMTYLFAIIAISVINALGVEVNYGGQPIYYCVVSVE